MNCKEDLIGTQWKCPYIGCGGTEIITEEGVKHEGTNHSVYNTLEQIFKFRQHFNELHRKMIYGKD